MLYIYHDGTLADEVKMSGLSSKEAMHSLMQSRGFVKRTDEGIEEVVAYLKFQQEEAHRMKFLNKQRQRKEQVEELKIYRVKEPIWVPIVGNENENESVT